MSNFDHQSLQSSDVAETREIGYLIANSVIDPHTTIWLSGEMGAGKTTLTQGIAVGLGIQDAVVSPTYALENRYDDQLLHADLYRLDAPEAERIIEESDTFPGVRVIEWSERLSNETVQQYNSAITVAMTEVDQQSRSIDIAFYDCAWPDEETIQQWRSEMQLPEHIAAHCDTVATHVMHCADVLVGRGHLIRTQALHHAALLHDLLRFVDFHDGAHPRNKPQPTEQQQKTWHEVQHTYGTPHETAIAKFLREKGYPGLAHIVQPHGLRSLDEPNALRTIEQKLLFYADKCVKFDEIVSLDERFDDFVERYGKGVESEDAKRWRRMTKELEKELGLG